MHLPLLEKLLYPFLFFQSSGWLEQKQKPLDFEHLPLGEINKLLEVFYAEAKGKNADYSRSTLTCIRAGINRYLRNPPFQRDIAITMAPEFSSSNKMLSAVLKNMKREGKDKTKSYPPISENDLAKIQNFKAFNIRDPKQLQLKVFFDIQYNLCARGRENVREYKKSHFHFGTDDSGLEYVELNYFPHQKNHQDMGPSNQPKPRMYAHKDPFFSTDRCPVVNLKYYLSKLSPQSDVLFCKERTGDKFDPFADRIWYTNKVHGVGAIGDFMKDISKLLNLSQTYTNHSIRTTSINTMSANGLEARQIVRVSGHKNESSISNYVHDNTVAQKRKISEILAGNPKVARSETAASSTITATSAIPLAVPLEPSSLTQQHSPSSLTQQHSTAATMTMTSTQNNFINSAASSNSNKDERPTYIFHNSTVNIINGTYIAK